MTIEKAMRWSRLWWLLSLDLTAKFRSELWLTIIGPNLFDYIRSTLNEGADLPTYGFDPRPRVYGRLKGFEEKFGREALQHLSWWERCVLIHEGSDRTSEFLWRMALYSQPSSLAGSAIVSAFDSVRRKCAMQAQELEKKVTTSQPSAWDRRAINAEGASRDEVLNAIRAIANANAFARAWHFEITAKGTEFLREVFNTISAIPPSKELQFDPESIPFPSSWEFELQFPDGWVGHGPKEI